MTQEIIFRPIGEILTSFDSLEGMPIQPSGAVDEQGTVRVHEEFVDGLADLAGFSHIYLFYCFHKSSGYSLQVTPFMDTNKRGLFSTRAPRRPNPLGISVVRLLEVRSNELTVQGIDVLNGTPLLDIKPYVPKFDSPQVLSTGWLEKNAAKSEKMRSDRRFSDR